MQRRTTLSLSLFCYVLLAIPSTALAKETAETKSIVVFGATGTIGQSIVAEALSRGHDVTGVSRSPEKFEYTEKNFTGARGDPTDATSVTELTTDVDAIIIAVGGRTATLPEETAMNQTAIAVTEVLSELGSHSPQVVVIGGGMTMLGSRENMIQNMPPNAPEGSAMYALFLGHWDAYETYMKSEINWTFVAPPMNLLGFRKGPDVRTGIYRASTSERVVAADGKSEISMSDLAVAAVDFAEETSFNRVMVTVGY